MTNITGSWSEIYVPLRSNAGWFTSKSNRAALESRMKNLVFAYDRVLVQDGQYVAAVWKHGFEMSMLVPPRSLPPDRTDEHIDGSGMGPTLMINERVISQGPADLSVVVDYVPLINTTGLAGADFVKVVPEDLLNTNPLKQSAREMSRRLREGLTEATGTNNEFLHFKLIEALYIDLTLGNAVERPVSIDGNTSRAVEVLMTCTLSDLLDDPRLAVHDVAVDFGIPDVGTLDWPELIDARESAAGREYRQMISRIAAEAQALLLCDAPPSDVKSTIHRAFQRELVEEVLKRRTGWPEQTAEMCLNLVPFGAGISGLNTLRKLVLERQSWVALLKPKIN